MAIQAELHTIYFNYFTRELFQYPKSFKFPIGLKAQFGVNGLSHPGSM
jgi:hypothetical protein